MHSVLCFQFFVTRQMQVKMLLRGTCCEWALFNASSQKPVSSDEEEEEENEDSDLFGDSDKDEDEARRVKNVHLLMHASVNDTGWCKKKFFMALLTISLLKEI